MQMGLELVVLVMRRHDRVGAGVAGGFDQEIIAAAPGGGGDVSGRRRRNHPHGPVPQAVGRGDGGDELRFGCRFGAQAVIDGDDEEFRAVGSGVAWRSRSGEKQCQRVRPAGDGKDDAGGATDAAGRLFDGGGERRLQLGERYGTSVRLRQLRSGPRPAGHQQLADFCSLSSLRFTLALICG
ncbi:hypothetical protein GGR03_003113 [Aurantimonas endophytica]|uniref:Uncharacterized protein n=1 Tax=Aurantimonas endophytica TaxID=1522175 RepID=A0A7W6MQI5_9HYPH|nr:hypothetical protein [Aurantimonas endophytica]